MEKPIILKGKIFDASKLELIYTHEETGHGRMNCKGYMEYIEFTANFYKTKSEEYIKESFEFGIVHVEEIKKESVKEMLLYEDLEKYKELFGEPEYW